MSPTLMQCPKCLQGNPEWARFCNGCGASIPLGPAAEQASQALSSGPAPEVPRAGLLVAERYRLLREIGRGAFGVVFEAKDLSTGDGVAIKFLNVFLMVTGFEGQQMRARFAREWSAGMKLSHPLIARMLDSGEDRGVPFIVMELVAGETLGQVLARDGTLPLEKGLLIIGDVLEALAHAHQQGIIHRDVKPSNVMVDASGRARLLDFGIAKLMETFSGSLMTQTGLLGTPSYMSPEQASGGKIDRRSDLFSVGLLAYEVLTGRRAFEGHPAAIINQILTKEVPPAPQLPQGLQSWLARATQRDPDERFGSASAMLEALQSNVSRLTSLAAQETMASPSSTLAVKAPPAEPAKREDRPRPGLPGERALTVTRVAAAITALLLVFLAFHRIYLGATPEKPARPFVKGAHPALPAPPVPAKVEADPAEVVDEVAVDADASEEDQYMEQREELHRLQTDHYLARRQADPTLQEGLAGFELREMDLEDIPEVQEEERPAVFRGPDSTTYVLKEGDAVSDAVLRLVEDKRVLFRPLQPDPLKLRKDIGDFVLWLPGEGPKGWADHPLDRAPEKIQQAATGTVQITSTPPGAAISIDGKEKGTTPDELEVPLGKSVYLVLKLQGYVDFEDPSYVQRKEEGVLDIKMTRRPGDFGIVVLESQDTPLVNRAVAKLWSEHHLPPLVLGEEGAPRQVLVGFYDSFDAAESVAKDLRAHGYPKARVKKVQQ